MSSFLWLLLYLAPLLGLTAAVFAWFGWHWRGSDLHTQPKELEPPHTAEADAHPQQNEDELRALRDELNSARAETLRCQDEAAKAREASQALESEAAKLLHDLDHLRTERDQAAAALMTAQAELAHLRSSSPTTDEAPAKPKRKRTTAAKPKTAAAIAPSSLREKITALETRLATQQSAVATLAQERDDWRRQVNKHEGQTPADPSGLALARRRLVDSEKRLSAATAEIERLQNQARVLQSVEQQSNTLTLAADDDLTQIKGIKKVINEQLRSHGIRTWRQIAQWDEDELRAFSELLAFKNRATREQWKEQARALHEAAHGPL